MGFRFWWCLFTDKISLIIKMNNWIGEIKNFNLSELENELLSNRHKKGMA